MSDLDQDDEDLDLDFSQIENLFWNEMLLMDDSTSHRASAMLSAMADADVAALEGIEFDGGGGGGGEDSGGGRRPPMASSRSAYAEKSILREYGVETGPVPPSQEQQTDIEQDRYGLHQEQDQNVFASQPQPHAAVAPTVTGAQPGDAEDHSKLVSEFTTLASRLGIRLPPGIIEAINADTSSSIIAGRVSTPGGMATLTDPSFAVGTHTHKTEPWSQTSKEMEETAKAALAATQDRMKRKGRSQSSSAAAAATANTSIIATSESKTPATKKRKMGKIQELQEKLDKLKTENVILKRHLETVVSESRQSDIERKQFIENLNKSVYEGASTEEMYKLMSEFADIFSDYGKRRQQELSFHLEQIQRLATPSQATKLGLWTVAHGETSDGTTTTVENGLKGNKKRNPLVDILTKELGVTEQQDRRIKEKKERLRMVMSKLNESLGQIVQIKTSVGQNLTVFHERMEAMRRIFSPRQFLKMLAWVEENSSMIDKCSPAWAAEMMRVRTKKQNHIEFA